MTIIIKEGDSIEKLRGFALVELMVSCSVLLILIMIAKSSNSTDNERIISNKLKPFWFFFIKLYWVTYIIKACKSTCLLISFSIPQPAAYSPLLIEPSWALSLPCQLIMIVTWLLFTAIQPTPSINSDKPCYHCNVSSTLSARESDNVSDVKHAVVAAGAIA